MNDLTNTKQNTPPPWHVADDRPLRACLHIRDGNGSEIALLYFAPGDLNSCKPDPDGVWRNDHIRIANAHVISAAPELLEVVRQVIAVALFSGTLSDADLDKAIAAEAKARGAA